MLLRAGRASGRVRTRSWASAAGLPHRSLATSGVFPLALSPELNIFLLLSLRTSRVAWFVFVLPLLFNLSSRPDQLRDRSWRSRRSKARFLTPPEETFFFGRSLSHCLPLSPSGLVDFQRRTTPKRARKSLDCAPKRYRNSPRARRSVLAERAPVSCRLRAGQQARRLRPGSVSRPCKHAVGSVDSATGGAPRQPRQHSYLPRPPFRHSERVNA